MKTTIERRSQTKNFLQNVEILKQLKEYELFTMADAMQEMLYEEGDVICRQGDAGSNFYIIKQGSVVCTQADAQGKQQEVAHLTANFSDSICAFARSRNAQPCRLVITSVKSHCLPVNLARRQSSREKIMVR